MTALLQRGEVVTTLPQALQSFVAVYHAASDLVTAQNGWNCTIALVATDSNEAIALQIEDGRVVHLGGQPEAVDLLIRSDWATLYDILTFQRDPNEPYLFGELTVQGPEEHFLRLDYIATMLCAP